MKEEDDTIISLLSHPILLRDTRLRLLGNVLGERFSPLLESFGLHPTL